MEGGIRDWLASLSRREVILVGMVGLAAAGGAGLWYVRSLPRPVEVRAAPRTVAPSPQGQPVFVHVAGWVRNPGVYQLEEGRRVIDALDMAGGPRRGAELGALNLAALLVDGQQVLVPGPAPPGGAPDSGSAVPGATPGSTLINVNTATLDELETLPGIGEVLAQAVVTYREEHGPFTSVDQLEAVSGIGPATLEEIRDLVTV
jgi:competence protein ComEA